ncbi:hypothetical protein HAX54_035939 [Datura stramonium]|uniref:Plant heme peroxidase family profile domain-containing protein n=1 Tax=Datura stramonium TaxID=4076 RepID=A0ABS8SFW9_DATST|nr:hypothetical protein [Datura stramonium]
METTYMNHYEVNYISRSSVVYSIGNSGVVAILSCSSTLCKELSTSREDNSRLCAKANPKCLLSLQLPCSGCIFTIALSGYCSLGLLETVVVTGGPYWNVPTGRRDGRISNASEALANIPPPTSNFSSLQKSFASKGLDLKDLVLLSGAHTIGVSHCPSFSSMPIQFTGILGKQDPSLDSEYAATLKTKKCKSINDNTTIVEMDPGSSTMEKMGKIEVKTGSAGEIRKHCAVE